MIDEDRLRDGVRETLLSEIPAPSPGYEARVISALNQPHTRHRPQRERSFESPPWLITATAIGLAVAVVATFIAWPRTGTRPAPAHTSPPEAVEANAKIPPSTSRSDPRMQFFTPDTGWLTVRRGQSTDLYKTADGGATWAGPELTWSSTNQQSQGMRFFSPKQGLLFAYTKQAHFWRTQDSGKSWIPIHLLLDGSYVMNWDFISTKEGWVIYMTDPLQSPSPSSAGGVSNHYIAHTTDAGDNWDVTKIAQGEFFGAGGLRFLNSKSALMVGGNEPRVVRSRDGGVTWQRAALALPEDAPPETLRLQAPGFFNSHDGVMLADAGNRAYIYTTRDGGDTWSLPSQVPGVGDRLQQARISFANPDCWWAVTAGLVRITSDGGRTWRTAAGQLPGEVMELEAVDYSRAWISTTGGLMYRTTDSGATWLLVSTPPK
jgi:photosystem II stability/assembly factor-like uncharacterized protein